MLRHSTVCIIPARGGSKRIPHKNIKKFLGKPIIAYSIESAVHCQLFTDVIVSTDDARIASVAESFGATVPFYRSQENSDDYAGLADVMWEVVQLYIERTQRIDSFCCILPTAPLITKEDLKIAHSQFSKTEGKAVVSVVQYSYPIQRALMIDAFGKLEMVNDKFKETRSQDLEPRYHDAGQFYFVDVHTFIHEKSLIPEGAVPYKISEIKAQDIDTLDDWNLAELKYKHLYK